MRFRLQITVLFLLVSVLLFSNCATTSGPVVIGLIGDTTFNQMAAKGEVIFLLSPHMTFEDAATEASLPSEQHGGAQVHSVMMSTAFEKLHEAGFRVLTQDSVEYNSQAAAGSVIKNLNEECRVLTSDTKDKSALLPLLRQLAEITGANLACVQTVKVKVGSGAMYDFVFSGAMRQGTSSSTINVVLVSLKNGDIVWRNESFVRHKPPSSEFNKSVKMLFETSKRRRD
jgi:hypothetical protein